MSLTYLQPKRPELVRAAETIVATLSAVVPQITYEILTAEHTGVRYVLLYIGLEAAQEPLMMCPRPGGTGWELVCGNTFSQIGEGTTLGALVAWATPVNLFEAYERVFDEYAARRRQTRRRVKARAGAA